MLQKLGTTHFRPCPAALRETVHDMPGCVSVMSVSEKEELLEEDMQLRLLGNVTAPSTVWALTSALRAQLLKSYPQLQFPEAPIPVDPTSVKAKALTLASSTTTCTPAALVAEDLPSTREAEALLSAEDSAYALDSARAEAACIAAAELSSSTSSITTVTAGLHALAANPQLHVRTALQLLFFCLQLLLSRMQALVSDSMAAAHHQ